jgi:hypothetical protein
LHSNIHQQSKYSTLHNERKNICDQLYTKYGYGKFEWCNQSYNDIAKSIYKLKFGNLDKITSVLNMDVWNIFNEYSIGPYIKFVS